MNSVNFFLQDIVSEKIWLENPEEGRKFYLDNVYGDEQKEEG